MLFGFFLTIDRTIFVWRTNSWVELSLLSILSALQYSNIITSSMTFKKGFRAGCWESFLVMTLLLTHQEIRIVKRKVLNNAERFPLRGRKKSFHMQNYGKSLFNWRIKCEKVFKCLIYRAGRICKIIGVSISLTFTSFLVFKTDKAVWVKTERVASVCSRHRISHHWDVLRIQINLYPSSCNEHSKNHTVHSWQ